MDKNSTADSVYYMPLKSRTFKTLSRLMTDNELATCIGISDGQRYLKSKEFINAMLPKRLAKYIFLTLACIVTVVVTFTVVMMIRQTSTPTMVLYCAGFMLWMIPISVFALDEHKNNVRKGRILSRVFWLAEFRNYRYIGQVEQARYLPYFDMTEPSAADYDGVEA